MRVIEKRMREEEKEEEEGILHLHQCLRELQRESYVQREEAGGHLGNVSLILEKRSCVALLEERGGS